MNKAVNIEAAMHITIEVELSETVGPKGAVETRRFSREAEMPAMPRIGQDIDLGVGGGRFFGEVQVITRNVDDGSYVIRVAGRGLTVMALREDGRWNERLL
jgi:hypothetical protein